MKTDTLTNIHNFMLYNCVYIDQWSLLSMMIKYKTRKLQYYLTFRAATLIFISGCGSAISSAKEGKSGFIYNLVKS